MSKRKPAPRGGLIRLVESARAGGLLTEPRTVYSEAILLPEAAATAKARRFKATLIEAGWSKNGRYWSTDVLRRDGPRAIPEGALMAGDHPSASERADRPEGSIFRVLSRVSSTPAWNPKGGKRKQGALEADVEVFPHADPILTPAFAESIGLSVRVSGTGEQGEAEGREGLIITSIDEGGTVDWVTYPGAGGGVIDLLESARPVPMHEGHGMSANDLRRALQDAIDSQYRIRCCWAWIADYSDDWVVFDLSGSESEPGRYQQAYTVDSAGTATLTGEPVEVNTQTRYVPVIAEAPAATEAAPPPVPTAAPFAPETPAPVPAPAPVAESVNPKEAVPVTTPEPTTGAPPTGAPLSTTVITSQIDAVEASQRRIEELNRQLTEARAEAEAKANDRLARVKAEQALDESRMETARLRAIETARSVAQSALSSSGLPECVHSRVIAGVTGHEGHAVPLNESRGVDTDALKESVASAVKSWQLLVGQILESAGLDGAVRGLGAPAGAEMTEAQFNESMTARFARLPGMTEKTAAAAAKGR